ncbi:glycerophosphodiester phosphodiesterase family protein [Marinifilum fragile]|uniref:glycerophosphodiester phosphodiesterase n=1 Tax=Marinifilum fragile TaxID=570161 RepID=UPI002AA9543B|nr:glycerophosphodiester phosphodiesterase family protein [Marinifilum fragile]
MTTKKRKYKKILLLMLCIPILYGGFHYIKITTFSKTMTHSTLSVIAHRGASANAPENTLAAVKQALNDRANMIEIDVHLSKDGKICVMHDNKVNRTTDGKGRIKNLDWQYIQSLDAGAWYSSEFKGETVPLLQEVLNCVNGQSKLIIEIKNKSSYYPGIEKKVVDCIQQYKAENWCIVQSFHYDVLDKIHQLEPKLELHKLEVFVIPSLKIALGTTPHLFKPKDYIKSYNINCFFLSEGIVQKLHQLNKKVNAWTCDSPSVVNRMEYIGVDGVITNEPEAIKNMDKD